MIKLKEDLDIFASKDKTESYTESWLQHVVGIPNEKIIDRFMIIVHEEKETLVTRGDILPYQSTSVVETEL